MVSRWKNEEMAQKQSLALPYRVPLPDSAWGFNNRFENNC